MRLWAILNVITAAWAVWLGTEGYVAAKYYPDSTALIEITAILYMVFGILIIAATILLIKKKNWAAYLSTVGYAAVAGLSASIGHAPLEMVSVIMAMYNFTLLEWVAAKIKKGNFI